MNFKYVKTLFAFACALLFGSCTQNECRNAHECTLGNNAPFQVGVNPGYYPKYKDYAQGSFWSDIDMGKLAVSAGFSTYRPALFSSMMSLYGPTVKLEEFKSYRETGLKNLVLFVSGGWDVVGDPGSDRDNQNYGCAEQSKSFKGLYDPIFDSAHKINAANRFAVFIENVVKHYGGYIKYIEVWNEPDLTNNDLVAQRYDYAGRVQQDSWWTRAPKACELTNLYAPPSHYIRMLRITYEIVNQYNRDKNAADKLLVTTGGIGYPSFLKYILSHTDNPQDGRATSDYPLKGGAYFDVLSFHSYPFFINYAVDPQKGVPVPLATQDQKLYQRHSDHLKNQPTWLLEDLRKVLIEAGYDGDKYPLKSEIVTEIGMHDKPWGIGSVDYSSTTDLQRNTLVKSLVKLQASGVKQIHLYKLGNHINPETPLIPGIWNELQGGLWASFGVFDDLTQKSVGTESLTSLGQTVKTFLVELRDYEIDQALTKKLNLPPSMDGAAFRKDAQVKFLLWAKSTRDREETAIATYSFPSDILSPGTNVKKVYFNGQESAFLALDTLDFQKSDPVLIYRP